MATQQMREVYPIMIDGDELLLALNVLYGAHEHVQGIDERHAMDVLNRVLGISPPNYGSSALHYAYKKIDAAGTLRRMLRAADGPAPGGSRLRGIKFNARVLLDELEPDVNSPYPEAYDQLEKFFKAVAYNDLLEKEHFRVK